MTKPRKPSRPPVRPIVAKELAQVAAAEAGGTFQGQAGGT